jgi:hypothetical protein
MCLVLIFPCVFVEKRSSRNTWTPNPKFLAVYLGTSVEEELEEIRLRKEEREGGGRLKKALQTIYERANTLSPEGALDWLGGRMKDHAEMVRV